MELIMKELEPYMSRELHSIIKDYISDTQPTATVTNGLSYIMYQMPSGYNPGEHGYSIHVDNMHNIYVRRATPGIITYNLIYSDNYFTIYPGDTPHTILNGRLVTSWVDTNGIMFMSKDYDDKYFVTPFTNKGFTTYKLSSLPDGTIHLFDEKLGHYKVDIDPKNPSFIGYSYPGKCLVRDDDIRLVVQDIESRSINCICRVKDKWIEKMYSFWDYRYAKYPTGIAIWKYDGSKVTFATIPYSSIIANMTNKL